MSKKSWPILYSKLIYKLALNHDNIPVKLVNFYLESWHPPMKLIYWCSFMSTYAWNLLKDWSYHLTPVTMNEIMTTKPWNLSTDATFHDAWNLSEYMWLPFEPCDNDYYMSKKSWHIKWVKTSRAYCRYFSQNRYFLKVWSPTCKTCPLMIH